MTFLSDISDHGRAILDEDLKTNHQDQRRNSRHKFPIQQKSTQKYWKQWIQYLKSKYCVPHSYQLQKKYQLGKWIKPVQEHNIIHRYYYSPTLNKSYDNELKKKYQCKKLAYNKCEVVRNLGRKLTSHPANSIPIDIHKSTFI